MPETFDGTVSFRGGQNAGLLPEEIAPDQYFKGVNVTTKGGALRPRPPIKQRPITVLTEGGIQLPSGRERSYKDIYRHGKFQGSGVYNPGGGEILISVIGGIPFRVNPRKGTATVVPIADREPSLSAIDGDLIQTQQRLNGRHRRVRMNEAGRFFVMYDYPDLAVIIDGADARRSDPDKYEIPQGAAIGAYNQSRLFVASITSELIAGDRVGLRLTPDAPITFEEVFAPAAQYAAQGNFTLGNTNINTAITALGFLQAVDGSTEIGPLFAGTKKQVYAFRSDLPRAQWEQSQFGTLILNEDGIAGHRSYVNIGSDILFVDGDGRIRSFTVARSDQGRWSNTPVDKEVSNWVKFVDKDLIELAVVCYFDKRVYFTVNPFRTQAVGIDEKPVLDYAHHGMVVLEMDNLSTFLRDASPAWAGLWNGIRPMDMQKIDDRMYIYSKDPGGVNELYYIEKEEPDEYGTYVRTVGGDVYNGCEKQIVSRVYTRSYTGDTQGGAGQFTLKSEMAVLLGLRDLEGEVNILVERQPDSFPKWRIWREWKHTAKTLVAEVPDDATLQTLLPHTVRELNLGSPKDQAGCNAVNNEDLSYFNALQLRLTLTGRAWRLQSIRLKANLEGDDQRISEDTCTDREVENLDPCDQSDFDLYSIAPRLGDECLL